jgi:hypothetical protein
MELGSAQGGANLISGHPYQQFHRRQGWVWRAHCAEAISPLPWLDPVRPRCYGPDLRGAKVSATVATSSSACHSLRRAKARLLQGGWRAWGFGLRVHEEATRAVARVLEVPLVGGAEMGGATSGGGAEKDGGLGGGGRGCGRGAPEIESQGRDGEGTNQSKFGSVRWDMGACRVSSRVPSISAV